MTSDSHFDVIIIGTGAGGGMLTYHLAPSGKRILLLERGDVLPRELQNWDAEEVFVKSRYIAPDTWYDSRNEPFQPQAHYALGGATKLYGAALKWLRWEDCGALRHYDGISPAWPISHEELEFYYAQAEHLSPVHGLHGEYPTDPPASAPYPSPPVANEPRIQQLFDDLKAGGYHPFHASGGILLDEQHRAASTCIRCQTCDGHPCLVHAKADAEVICVRPALQHPTNVTLLTHAHAVKLHTTPSGRAVTEVEVERHGAVEAYHGDIMETAWSWRGASPTRPSCCCRPTTDIQTAWATGLTRSGATICSTTAERYWRSRVKRPSRCSRRRWGSLASILAWRASPIPSMGNIQMTGNSVPAMCRGERSALTRLAPTWSLAEMAQHAVDFWLSTEDLPTPNNRVTVDARGPSKLSYSLNNLVPAERPYDKLKPMLPPLGFHPEHPVPRDFYLQTEIPVAGVGHQADTCRFGTDPQTSVLYTNCKVHALDNRYVVNTSCFPSIGTVNPALTVMANALRVGDHLLARLA
jgi:choline dehydrogenase-like flavoprotein